MVERILSNAINSHYEKLLAGVRKVQVYPMEWGQLLRRDLSKKRAPNPLFWEFPNLVVCNFFRGSALLRSFAPLGREVQGR